MREALWRVAQLVAAALAVGPLVLLAIVEGVRTRGRRRRGGGPRLLWGPTPVIAIRDWSAAVSGLGYESLTFARNVYDINNRGDFDVHRDAFLAGIPRADAARDFVVFAWALRHADVFLSYLNGGYLRDTLLARLEGPLLRLASKKLIVFPYGSDIAVPGHLGVAEGPLLRDYPTFARTGEAVRTRVLYFCRWADLVIRNYQYGFLPRADVLWPTMIAIDSDHWHDRGHASVADGRDGPVTVVHAPNHRHVKGTQFLLDAVAALREDGLDVRLDLIERRPNEEVRRAVLNCDVVAEQFIAGYALFAIEGMSAGKPVLSAMRALAPDIRATTEIGACPIVDAATDDLKDQLRRVVTDPDLRADLGREGRRFVLAHHAREPVGWIWATIIDRVWRELPVSSPAG